MRKLAGTIMAALVAVLAFGAIMASTAGAATHPLFLTASGKTLLFLGEGSKPVLRGEVAGVVATVECEKVLVHGLILHESSLAHLLPLLFEGKCEQKIPNRAAETCEEHITTKPILAELGLLKSGSKTVVMLLAPGDGTTTFVVLKCGGNTTTVSGTIVGEIPEKNSEGQNQYDVERETLEVIFATSPAGTNQQAITTIFLLGVEMTGQELKIAGFLGGKASEEATANLKADGKVKIDL
jgi:hypothetical protein